MLITPLVDGNTGTLEEISVQCFQVSSDGSISESNTAR